MRLTLLDWRRRVSELYAVVREMSGADPGRAHEHWRAGRDGLFATHPESPLTAAARNTFTGLPVVPYDPAYRFDVSVDPAAPEAFEAATGSDGLVGFRRLGRIELAGLGGLDVWWCAVYGGGVFLPMRDATSTRTTYGGGRYVLDTIKGADLGGIAPSPDDTGGRLIVDLNFAFNPSCAYDSAWACPLAPPGNVLDVAVPVGEMSAADRSSRPLDG
jgi:uncharacterized protein